MCLFLTLVLPADARPDALRPLLASHRLRLDPARDRELVPALVAGEQAFTTGGYCDCGTALALRRSRRAIGPGEVARLRRSGWSEAKVKRWIEQRKGDVERKERKRDAEGRSEITFWQGLLGELLDSGLAQVGFLVHMADDAVQRGPLVPRAELAAATAHGLPENVLYLFSRR